MKRMGSSQEALSISFKLHPGGNGTGQSLPRHGQETRRPSSPKPISSTIDMKISQMAEKYHNPDPLLRLIGPANEATIFVEGQKFPALLDSGAQLSTMSESLVKLLQLPIHKLNTSTEAEVSGGGTIPYIGYVEARPKIPGIKTMDKDSLFMVSNNSPYMNRVPIQLGTLHIREAIQCATKDKIEQLPIAWKTANFPPLDKSMKVQEPKFDLNQIQGNVKLTKSVTIAPFQTVHVSGLTECTQHFKRVNVIVEPDPNKDYESVIPIHGYTVLKPGSSRVSIGLRNHSCRRVTITAKCTIAKMTAANIVPHSLAPNLDNEDMLRQYEQYRERLEQGHGNSLNPSSLSKPELTPEKEKLLFNKIDLSGATDWDPELLNKARQLFRDYAHIFALDSLDMGHTSMVKHKIRLDNYTPFKERYCRIPPNFFDEVKNHLKEMIEVGAIRKSSSPWASAVVLVRKKDGSLQFCIDLRKLNARTIKDAYSLPRIDETLDCLGGATIFTSLDLKSGYWQVEMEEDSKPLTAFTVGPLGFYECERMPFGLTNAPATFQCLMENCLGELHLSWCIIYLDDIIVFSDNPADHLQRLQGVFAKLDKAGLKLKPSKCEFFKTKITYLGHVVSSQGIELDPKKVETVKNWTVPKTVTDVRSFLGFMNHYRRFIKGYANVARPLNILVSGENANRKKALIEWTDECQTAFDKLKELCTSAPVLAYADYKKPFQLQTDTSDLGLGAVLYQRDGENHQRVIAFASRSLSNTERNYPAHKLEFLALKWAITDRFHEYLYGGQFDVYTDNNPLTYILTSAKLDATGQRWVASLANYDFRIFYKSGKTNVEADALSRISREQHSIIDIPTVKAIMTATTHTDWSEYNTNPLEIVCKSTQTVVHKKSKDDWKLEQENDPIISPVLKLMKDKSNDTNGLSDESKRLFRNRSRLLFHSGLLYRKVFDGQLQENKFQFVLAKPYWKQSLEACHENMGHLGIERTTSLLKD